MGIAPHSKTAIEFQNMERSAGYYGSAKTKSKQEKTGTTAEKNQFQKRILQANESIMNSSALN